MTTLDSSSPPDRDEGSPLNIATELRYLREQKGLSLDDVTAQLCVSKTYLQAIEDADLSCLPERVYVLGFIRAYAQLLGIDTSLCVQRFRAEVLKEGQQESLSFLKPLPSEIKPSSRLVTFSTLLLTILFILGYGSFKWRDPLPMDLPDHSLIAQNTTSVHPSSELTPTSMEDVEEDSTSIEEERREEEQASDIPNVSTPASTSSLSSLPNITPTTTTPALALFLSFTQSCWIELKNARQEVVFQKTFQAGERFTPSQTPGLHLKAGNAGGVEIHFSNGNVGTLGEIGEVTTHVSLDEEALSDYLKARAQTP